MGCRPAAEDTLRQEDSAEVLSAPSSRGRDPHGTLGAYEGSDRPNTRDKATGGDGIGQNALFTAGASRHAVTAE
ncbi:hypothetical protein GCM10027418_23530 [Mariniluteicoccus endophyticus]